jgi:uncharacterized protein (TIGR02266 family)
MADYTALRLDSCHPAGAVLKEVPHPHFREHSRAPLKAPVKLQFESWSEPLEGFTGNISVGGMFVETTDPKAVGTYLRFEIRLPGEGDPVRGLGEVVWLRSRSEGPDLPKGMGIQFRHFQDQEYQRLERIVEALITALEFPHLPALSREELNILRSAPGRDDEPDS